MIVVYDCLNDDTGDDDDDDDHDDVAVIGNDVGVAMGW
mgnify:CR=1 FL=1